MVKFNSFYKTCVSSNSIRLTFLFCVDIENLFDQSIAHFGNVYETFQALIGFSLPLNKKQE